MNENPIIKIIRLRPAQNSDVPLPKYMTSRSVGMDIYAAVSNEINLYPGNIELIPTGFAIAIPDGFEAQIRPRSGLAANHGITVINSPGTIDPDYRGEVFVPIINLGQKPFKINRGDRIAQMLIKKVFYAKLNIVESLDKTERDTGGFGHTGI
jgi:dUTP pyrophosphatase